MDRRGAVLGTLVQHRRDARMNGGSRRRLVAILFADIVGYSRMMAEDETATVAAVRTLRREVIEPRVIGRGGRPFATLGDGFVAEFPSAVEAVACAVEVQRGLAAIGPGRLRGVTLRMAVDLGDMVVDPGGDMFGDAVNVAARLEALAEPGGVVVSGKTYEEIRGRLAYPFADAGEHSLKNIPLPVRVFSLPAAIIAALPEPAPGSGTRESSDAGAAPRRRRRIIALLAAGAALVAVAGVAGRPATAPQRALVDQPAQRGVDRAEEAEEVDRRGQGAQEVGAVVVDVWDQAGHVRLPQRQPRPAGAKSSSSPPGPLKHRRGQYECSICNPEL